MQSFRLLPFSLAWPCGRTLDIPAIIGRNKRQALDPIIKPYLFLALALENLGAMALYPGERKHQEPFLGQGRYFDIGLKAHRYTSLGHGAGRDCGPPQGPGHTP